MWFRDQMTLKKDTCIQCYFKWKSNSSVTRCGKIKQLALDRRLKSSGGFRAKQISHNYGLIRNGLCNLEGIELLMLEKHSLPHSQLYAHKDVHTRRISTQSLFSTLFSLTYSFIWSRTQYYCQKKWKHLQLTRQNQHKKIMSDKTLNTVYSSVLPLCVRARGPIYKCCVRTKEGVRHF